MCIVAWAMTEPTRKIARQATSAVAFTADEPDEDDPLLAFTPFLHRQPRRNSITPDLQRRFVATLAATGIVKVAARHIGKSLEALYKLRARPGAEGFAAAWDAALARGVQRLEDVAMERAMLGTPTPLVSGGKLLGLWNKPDNNLLRFLLRNRLPETYGASALAPGQPAYEAVRAELEADFAARMADYVRERDAADARREREREARLEQAERAEAEWEEEQARLAAEAAAARTPEEEERETRLFMLSRWSLKDLQERIDW